MGASSVGACTHRVLPVPAAAAEGQLAGELPAGPTEIRLIGAGKFLDDHTLLKGALLPTF